MSICFVSVYLQNYFNDVAGLEKPLLNTKVKCAESYYVRGNLRINVQMSNAV
jgi:hypothetical protein